MSGVHLEEQDLFERAACGLLMTGADGVIFRINATMCTWIGRDAAELVGRKKLQDLFSVGGRVFHQTHCLPMLQVQGSVAEVQVDVLHRDGSRVPMLMNIVRHLAAPAPSTPGAAAAPPAVHYDGVAFFSTVDRRSYERELLLARREAETALEARRGAEAQLQELNAKLSRDDRRKDEFLATLAHELRNPLAPIRNAVELLKMQAGTPPRPLQVLERQVSHLAHLVDDLMEISRITQGQVALRRAQLDLVAALRTAVGDAMPVIEAAGHTLGLNLPDLPLMVDADGVRLTQVVLNLLTNAAKYTPRGGRIVLSAWQDGGAAVIEVADNGIGIPPHSLGTIFEMFSQLTPALDRAQGGLGIGLALVRGLVELHGGTIRADSAGVGQGSVFTVRLPAPLADAAAPPADAAALASLAGAAGASLRILVVDDNPDVTDTMCMMLDLHGHATRAAHTGASALTLAAGEFAPHVILLDIGLPDMNGYDVARRVRAGGGQVFMVAATGWGQQEDRQRALDAGFDRHLTKPIDFAQLQRLLREAAATQP